ncbi:hypothetical protein M8C21_012203, partial [Ambrosia artemisiifolia]
INSGFLVGTRIGSHHFGVRPSTFLSFTGCCHAEIRAQKPSATDVFKYSLYVSQGALKKMAPTCSVHVLKDHR